jgi:uncharacterized membrane protein YebE (DUF533 family)
MFDAKNLLNMMLGAVQNQGSAGAQGGAGLQGGLGGMLGGLMNNLQQGTQGAGGAAGNLTNVLGSVLGGLQAQSQQGLQNAQNAAQQGNLAAQAGSLLQGNMGTLLAGGLAGLVAGRAMGGGLAKLGGLALVGGLAYKAMQAYQAGQAPQQTAQQLSAPTIDAAPVGSGFAEGDGDDNARALLMVRSMVAAAAADGHIDDMERQRIVGGLQQAGLDDEAAAFLQAEFDNPASVDGLLELATTPELATQVYAAARLAVEPDTEHDAVFLNELAGRLGLDEQLVAHIDAAAAQVTGTQAV